MQRLGPHVLQSAGTLSYITHTKMQRHGPHVLHFADTLSYKGLIKSMYDAEAGTTSSAFS